MKGATAEPFTRTMSPPRITMTTRTGISQYFLRALRYRQNSRTNDIWVPSELVRHALWIRPRRRAFDPVAARGRVSAEPKRILAEESHQQADRHNARQKYNSDGNRSDESGKHQAEAEPQAIGNAKNSRVQPGTPPKRGCDR